MSYKLVSKFKPMGDQPEAIKELVEGIHQGKKTQVLLGGTGTGKTFTFANVIAQVNKPTLVLSHNKTLAGQLYSELKEFFPENRVEYFISNFDFYQPEAYIPKSDTYIDKESQTNEEIEMLRAAAMNSLLERKDTIVVASVAAIYGLGNPQSHQGNNLLNNKVFLLVFFHQYDVNSFQYLDRFLLLSTFQYHVLYFHTIKHWLDSFIVN